MVAASPVIMLIGWSADIRVGCRTVLQIPSGKVWPQLQLLRPVGFEAVAVNGKNAASRSDFLKPQ